MRTFLIIALTMAFMAPPALAADIYLKPKQDALPEIPPASAPETAPEPAPVPEAQPPAAGQQADPLTIEEFSEGTYNKCIQNQNPILKGEPLRMFCACAAEKIKEKMTIEEIVAMTTETEAGQAQRNRLVVHVYAPCMEYPVRALLLNECKSKKEIQQQYAVNGAAICNCMADDMAKFIAQQGPGVLAERLTANPGDQDPMGNFLESQTFKAQEQSAFVACVEKNNPFEKKR